MSPSSSSVGQVSAQTYEVMLTGDSTDAAGRRTWGIRTGAGAGAGIEPRSRGESLAAYGAPHLVILPSLVVLSAPVQLTIATEGLKVWRLS